MLGTLALTVTGGGTVTLGNTTASNYSGATTIKSGTLIAGNANGVQGINTNSAVLLGDTAGSLPATLQLGLGTSTGYANNITVQSGNTGLMTLNGDGNITLSGTVTLGTASSTGKNLTITNTGSSTWTFSLNSAIKDPTNVIGAGTVTVGTSGGAGAVAFNGANTYSGGTTLTLGILDLGNATALEPARSPSPAARWTATRRTS